MATSGKSLPAEDRRYIERLRANGASLRDTAKQAGVSVPTVRKILKESR